MGYKLINSDTRSSSVAATSTKTNQRQWFTGLHTLTRQVGVKRHTITCWNGLCYFESNADQILMYRQERTSENDAINDDVGGVTR